MATTTSFVTGAQRTQGSAVRESSDDVPVGEHTLVKLIGPGVFVCAAITRQKEKTDPPVGVSSVRLDLDGTMVVAITFQALSTMGLTQSNPYGLMLVEKNPLSTIVIGYPLPLRFERELTLSVFVDEVGIAQISADVIHGTTTG